MFLKKTNNLILDELKILKENYKKNSTVTCSLDQILIIKLSMKVTVKP